MFSINKWLVIVLVASVFINSVALVQAAAGVKQTVENSKEVATGALSVAQEAVSETKKATDVAEPDEEPPTGSVACAGIGCIGKKLFNSVKDAGNSIASRISTALKHKPVDNETGIATSTTTAAPGKDLSTTTTTPAPVDGTTTTTTAAPKVDSTTTTTPAPGGETSPSAEEAKEEEVKPEEDESKPERSADREDEAKESKDESEAEESDEEYEGED